MPPFSERQAAAEDRAWQRLDKFLFVARFCRSRAIAGRLIGEGLVRVNRQVAEKPHAKLRPGDVLTLALGRGVVVVRVQALGARRGPAAEAGRLYEEIA